MKTHTFRGGIHPSEMKELSRECPIAPAFPASNTVTIPVTMGGAPNTPLVKVGDLVARGQKIAESDKFMSAPVHASIAGKVKKIQSCLVTGNTCAPCIVIEADGSDRTEFMQPLDPLSLDKAKILERIREAGIVGMGGASFPAHVKLNPPADKNITHVLVNAAECEPYLTCDERTMQETPGRLIDGLSIALRISSAKGIIALEDNKASIAPLLEKEISERGLSGKIEVMLVKTKYPQGSEKFIVSACLGREIPSARLPADAGCIICNVGTVCAISDAFRLGMPLIERALTVSGGACEKPCNLRVPVGTLVSDLMPSAFTVNDDACRKIISGGPMMGFAMCSAEFPIAKGTSGVTFLTEGETFLADEEQCIGCGACVKACPMKLSPVLISREVSAGDIGRARRFGLMDCIECGCCAFVCPASIRLVQRFRVGKAAAREIMAAEKARQAQNSEAKK